MHKSPAAAGPRAPTHKVEHVGMADGPSVLCTGDKRADEATSRPLTVGVAPRTSVSRHRTRHNHMTPISDRIRMSNEGAKNHAACPSRTECPQTPGRQRRTRPAARGRNGTGPPANSSWRCARHQWATRFCQCWQGQGDDARQGREEERALAVRSKDRPQRRSVLDRTSRGVSEEANQVCNCERARSQTRITLVCINITPP